MRPVRDIPIRQKLLAIIMAITTASLLLAGIGIVLTDSLLFRSYLRRDLAALSRIIADNSTAALAFDDPDAANEVLRALRARTHVVSACIYSETRTVLARYSRDTASVCPPPSPRDEIRFTPAGVIVSQPVVLAGRRIGTLTMLYDLGEVSERIRLYGTTVLLVLLATSLFAFLLSARLRALIVDPLAQLVRAMTSVAETGDYRTRARKLSGDELGVLADRFNEMLAGIQLRDQELVKERERFRFMAESMPQKIFTAAPTGAIDYFNRQWMEFTGLSFETIRDWGWTQIIHVDDLDEDRRAWQHSIATGEPFTFEHRFRRADGKYRWHLSRAHAMRDENGKITLWIGSSTEIHEQKEKEEALQRANDDLQQFAYSASHDLQEPIRNVAIYSELLAKRYQGVMDADGLQFLGFLKEGGHRLTRLVSDLLAYTRASMAELGETSADALAVLQSALASLAEAIRENEAAVTYDQLPEVSMAEAHLQQIFQNLVSNALKYRTEEPPRIHISYAGRGAFWCFSVQDNGIGIEPEYNEKIFGVFKRLNHDPKYAGTGIGLAICQRVVERYGGRIWVESAPGEGSVFYFTVPRISQSFPSAKIHSSVG